jgi:ECF transporter S component (folate family)
VSSVSEWDVVSKRKDLILRWVIASAATFRFFTQILPDVADNRLYQGGKQMKISSHKITTMGLLMALAIILTRIASLRIAIGGVEGIRIGLGRLPIILGGIIFGPLVGGIIGAFSDLIGYFINPIGVYMPHFTLTSALAGMIPAFVLSLFRKKEELKTLELGIAITAGQVITSIILISYFLNIVFGLPWKVLLPPRIVAEPIQIFIYTYTINMILKMNILLFNSKRI